MVQGSLDTTNVLLGIMAAASVLQALVLIGAGIMGYRLYSRAMQTVREIEERQVAPLMARVNGILDDVKGVTWRVNDQAARVDHAIRDTIDRVDEAADRAKLNLRAKVRRLLGLVRGIRAGVETFFAGPTHDQPLLKASGVFRSRSL